MNDQGTIDCDGETPAITRTKDSEQFVLAAEEPERALAAASLDKMQILMRILQ